MTRSLQLRFMSTCKKRNLNSSVLPRFEEKYEVCGNTGCWLWTASLTRGGYGQFKSFPGYRAGRAHIVSYVIHKGDIPEGMCVLHSCDNPKCVNPEHLWLGTLKDNSQDMMRKSRHVPVRLKGVSNPNVKLTEEQVNEIRSDNRTATSVSKDYGVSEWTIRRIRAGSSWK